MTVQSDRPVLNQKIVRRRRNANGKSNKYYFHEGTHAAIVKYQSINDNDEKNNLYVAEIYPAFEKLIENLINIHKFTSLHDSFDELKNDAVNFLFESINKFDPSRGTNSFSYFNVVAKNYLIVRSKQKTKRLRNSISVDDVRSMNTHECYIVEEHNTIPSQDVILEQASTALNIIDTLKDIRSRIRTENELACINSIITIFENIQDLDLLNRRALMLYMRELSGLSPKQLMTSMHVIRKHYRALKVEQDIMFLE